MKSYKDSFEPTIRRVAATGVKAAEAGAFFLWFLGEKVEERAEGEKTSAPESSGESKLLNLHSPVFFGTIGLFGAMTAIAVAQSIPSIGFTSATVLPVSVIGFYLGYGAIPNAIGLSKVAKHESRPVVKAFHSAAEKVTHSRAVKAIAHTPKKLKSINWFKQPRP